MYNSNDYAVKKGFTLALTYINLGMTSNASKKTKEAEEYFSKALAICKKDNRNKNLKVTVLNEFAWLYYDQKKYEESTNYAEQAKVLEK
ncbi:tetratricopeptide repeat protein [Chryseobacterium sp. G0201]|uniref:tetratricopeptide repeat protein n=1 Tax=Chryseobacterium sp. G0201 TaxID=2487065 RepID=UPI000F4E017C|nr:tetratricopeptide repeat protein [Chryseobacterium sp. G0201]AZA54001.1 tetratricopeptide repeat protein [Chryseobacterium sp. G0201]